MTDKGLYVTVMGPMAGASAAARPVVLGYSPN